MVSRTLVLCVVLAWITVEARPRIRRQVEQAINENQASRPGTRLFRLQSRSRGEYFQLLGPPNPYVSVEPNGDVLNRVTLDYEKLGANIIIQLWVAIKSRRTRRDIARQRVIIYVKDINDEIPVFINQPQPMTAVVPAFAKANTPVYTLKAVDSDADSDVRYRIVRQQPPGAFDINGFSGVIRTRGWYKFQPGMEFRLVVIAVDVNSGEGNQRMQSTPETNLYIRTKEQQLKFVSDNYEATIPDNLPLGSEIITVEARLSSRSYIIYSIPKRNGYIPFKISNENRRGVVRAAGRLFLEGREKIFIFTVHAQDYATNQVATAEVVVTVKRAIDLKPRFILPQYTASQIKENIAVNTSLLQVEAVDPVSNDTQFIYTCSLHLFRVDQTGMVYVNHPLDADLTQGVYLFHVFAQSKEDRAVSASAVIQVFLKNVNDEAPKFNVQAENRIVEVREEKLTGGKALLHVTATDPDGDQVKYKLKPSNDTRPFDIDENLGILRFKDVLLPLVKEEYKVDIVAYDDGSCCEENSAQHNVTTTVTIKVLTLDNIAPQFINCGNYRTTIHETARLGDKVMKVFAIDPQRERVLYSIVSYRQSRFSIDRKSGQIYVYQYLNKEEDGNKIYLTVRAEKASQPDIAGFCTVVITLTGNSRLIYSAPSYRPRRVVMLEVAENEEIRKGLVKIIPYIRRLRRFRDQCANFEIKSGNRGGAFSLNGCSGIVSVGGKIDYEKKRKYELRIRATDRLDDVLLIINVKNQNDNPPRFQKREYTVWLDEVDDLPKLLLSPQVSDRDSDETSFVFFTEDRLIGETSVGKALEIDRKRGSIYQIRPFNRNDFLGKDRRLRLMVQDEDGTGLVTHANIYFKNVQDDASPQFLLPVYNVSIPENGDVAFSVIRVSAANPGVVRADKPSILSYSLVGDDLSLSTFEIDEATGQITTIECCLDREEIEEYSFNVTVTNSEGLTDSAKVNVKIRDENDVLPKFNQTKYEVFLLKDDALTTSLMPLVKVSTNDSDLTNTFIYKVTGKTGHIGRKFTMVSNIDGTGTLYQTAPLTMAEIEKNNGEPSIVICVNDKGGDCVVDKRHSAFVKVFIVILEKRNKSPYFANSRVTITVPEDEKVNSAKWLTQVKATDPDGDVVWYEMKNDEEESRFSVDPEGKVFLLKELDRENQTLHKIEILATDQGRPQKTAKLTLTIKVEDVNDNPPELVEDSPAVIWENEAAGSRIKVRATDKDSRNEGNGAPFLFELDPNASDAIKNTFRVSQDYGRQSAIISTLQILDREYAKEYEIPIIITDNGKIAQSSTSTLTLTVGDKNDYVMRPYTKNTEIFAYKGELESTQIGRVYALDPDDWDIKDKTFYWKDGQRNQRFSVERTTGHMTVQKGTPPGNYYLKFQVHDRLYGNTVEADVAVNIRNIKQEVLKYVVGIQLKQVTSEEFLKLKTMGPLRISMRYSFVKTLQNHLQRNNKGKPSIDILNLKTVKGNASRLHVYFTTRMPGRKTKYCRPEKVMSILRKRQKEFERELGVEISHLDDPCTDHPDCYPCCPTIRATRPIHNTVDVNETSYVFINMEYQKECNCEGGADEEPSEGKLVNIARRYVNDEHHTKYVVSKSEVLDRKNIYVVFLDLAERRNPKKPVKQCQVEIGKPDLVPIGTKCKETEGCGKETQDKCINPKGDSKEVCSGNGACDCGECVCSGSQYSGKYCECDNLSCPKFKGKICGGRSRGECVCGTCECRRGWSSDDCSCSEDKQLCKSPDTGEICSGQGTCRCGACKCEPGYDGEYCEEVGECTDDKSTCKSGGSYFKPQYCSNRGECQCGECVCNKQDKPELLVYGDLCECDNFSCERFRGKICSGADNGICDCGECKCKEGWTGSNCNCTTLVDNNCMPDPMDDSPCSGNGDCVCGACVCDYGYSGHFCQTQENGCTENVSRCKQEPNGPVCSDRGVCVCGKCNCDIDEQPFHEVYGEFCECDNFTCPVFEGKICSGNGECNCTKCECWEGFGGDDCSSIEDEDACKSPDTGEICSGQGTCTSGACECEPGYEGDYCETIGECTDDKTTCKSGGSYFNPQYCSNRGECQCGRCICDKQDKPGLLVYGELCECDNFSCELFRGEICSGADNGICDCGECKCKEGWTGSNCNCTTLVDNNCMPDPMDDSPCSGNGDCVCGVCVCDSGYSGHFCQTQENGCTEDVSGCREDSGSPICSGRGNCVCGKCNCNTDEEPFHEVYGEFCECDNFTCPVFEDKICSGNGDCNCKKCECSEGWTGASCNCSTSEESCLYPGTALLCSDQGDCECNACHCDEGYSGMYCETEGCEEGWSGDACDCSTDTSNCETATYFATTVCSDQGTCHCGNCTCNFGYTGTKCENPPSCETLEECVKCNILDTPLSKNCEVSCKNVTYELSNSNVVDYNQCQVKINDCDVDFWFDLDTLPLLYIRNRCDEETPEESGSGLEDSEHSVYEDDEDYVEKEEENAETENEDVDKEDGESGTENGEDYYTDNGEDYDYEYEDGEDYEYDEYEDGEEPEDTTEDEGWFG